MQNSSKNGNGQFHNDPDFLLSVRRLVFADWAEHVRWRVIRRKGQTDGELFETIKTVIGIEGIARVSEEVTITYELATLHSKCSYTVQQRKLMFIAAELVAAVRDALEIPFPPQLSLFDFMDGGTNVS